MDSVDSSTSLPPQAPPEPVDTGSASSSSSADSASPPEQASGSSGNAGAAAAAAPSADFAKSWNADGFGSASDGVQAARAAGSAGARGGAPADRNADGFEPARASGRPPVDLTGGGAPPARQDPNGGAGAQVAQAQPGAQQLQGAQRPPPPQADPATRQRVQDEITRRLGGDANAQDIADRMARGLGNGDMRRGMDVLERGLRDNNLNVGLAGISGAFGGARDQRTLDALQRDMGTATGRNLSAVVDNDNGAMAASRGDPAQGQLAALRDIANLGNQLGVRVDLVSHSNGFNTLRQYLADNPNAHLGNVTLINPNIPPNLPDTQRGFQDMVGHSDRVRLITSIGDGVVPMSGAGNNNNGPVWQQQINSAARAGVQDITVLTRAGHNVDSVAGDIGRERANNLDFARDGAGRTVPRDMEAWRRQGFTWTPENGFRPVEQPQQQQQRPQPQPQQRPPAIPGLPGVRRAA